MYILSVFDIGEVIPFAIGIAFVFLIMLIRKANVRRILLLLLCLLVFCSGSVLFYSTDNIKSKSLYIYLDKDITINAEIISKPIADRGQISFAGRVISVDGKKIKSTSEKVLFKYYAKEDFVIDVNKLS